MVIVQHPSEPNDREPGKYGRFIEFGGRRDGGRAYLAHSDRVGPGVLLLHEWFGLQDSFCRLADRLCDEGFTVLAPDFYDGELATNEEEAAVLAKGADSDRTGLRMKAAARFLVDNWHPRLGVVGFSWGAWWAAWLAQQMPVEGTVLFYSIVDIDPTLWKGALQGHFAENDHFDTIDDVRLFLHGLEQGGVEIDAHVYKGVGHWFANPSVPVAYDEAAANEALGRTVEFFHHHLA